LGDHPDTMHVAPVVIANEFLTAHQNCMNVKHPAFGAKGDGITEDRKAIQKAIDSIRVLGGGVVFLPRGTYLIENRLNADSMRNITFRGEEGTVITIHDEHSCTLLVHAPDGATYLVVSNADTFKVGWGINIQGGNPPVFGNNVYAHLGIKKIVGDTLFLDRPIPIGEGEYSAGATVWNVHSFISFEGGTNLIVENIVFDGNAKNRTQHASWETGQMIHTRNSDSIYVRNCVFKDNLGMAYHIVDGEWAIVENCEFHNVGTNEFAQFKYAILRDNRFNECLTAVSTCAGNSDYLQVIGNQIYNAG